MRSPTEGVIWSGMIVALAALLGCSSDGSGCGTAQDDSNRPLNCPAGTYETVVNGQRVCERRQNTNKPNNNPNNPNNSPNAQPASTVNQPAPMQ